MTWAEELVNVSKDWVVAALILSQAWNLGEILVCKPQAAFFIMVASSFWVASIYYKSDVPNSPCCEPVEENEKEE